MTAITVLPLGTRVMIGAPPDPFRGKITAVCIEGEAHVTYKVAWWNGRARCCEWLTLGEFHLQECDVPHARIGFGSES